MKRKNIIVILALIITGIFVTIVSTSYAYLKRDVDTRKKVELIAGTLNYKIESTDLNNNRIIIPASSHKTITINIISLNKVDSKYELYYNITTNLTNIENNNLQIGYLPNSKDAFGNINAKETISIDVRIINNNFKDIEIEFGVEGGLPNNDLVLNNEHSS